MTAYAEAKANILRYQTSQDVAVLCAEDEWTMMRNHPTEGVLSLTQLRGITNLPTRMAAASFEHHMNLDYSGYPKLKTPWKLSLTGRILTIADCYDAMTSSRVYRREPMSPSKVLNMMLSKSGKSFDATLLKLFVNCVGIIPIGSLVVLDSDEFAVVLKPAESSPTIAWQFVQVMRQVGLPDGVINFLPGYGEDLRELAQATQRPMSSAQVRAWAQRAEAHSQRLLERAMDPAGARASPAARHDGAGVDRDRVHLVDRLVGPVHRPGLAVAAPGDPESLAGADHQCRAGHLALLRCPGSLAGGLAGGPVWALVSRLVVCPTPPIQPPPSAIQSTVAHRVLGRKATALWPNCAVVQTDS